MSTTTFSGPVKAGNIFNRTGNTLGENVANQGQATMVQVATVSETSEDPSWTGIVIPANSQITRIAFLVTSVFTAAVSHVGKSDSLGDSQPNRWFVYPANLQTLGLIEITTQIEAGFEAHWKDTGSADLHLTFYDTDPPGTGEAVLIVEYIQNNNLTA